MAHVTSLNVISAFPRLGSEQSVSRKCIGSEVRPHWGVPLAAHLLPGVPVMTENSQRITRAHTAVGVQRSGAVKPRLMSLQAVSGIAADGRQVVNRGIAEAQNYKRRDPVSHLQKLDCGWMPVDLPACSRTRGA